MGKREEGGLTHNLHMTRVCQEGREGEDTTQKKKRREEREKKRREKKRSKKREKRETESF